MIPNQLPVYRKMRRTPVGSTHNMNDIKNSEIIERENDQLISSLQGKVAALKSLTIDIGECTAFILF